MSGKEAVENNEPKPFGEFEMIERIRSRARLANPSSVTGIGDDAAIIDTGGGKMTLISTDLLLEGIHFDLTYFPLRHLGYKAAIVNLSDITAMNGKPKQITVNTALSNRFSREAIDELYEGIHAACEHYGVDLVGGDTSSSPGGLMLSITAIGEAEKDKIMYRHTAQPGDAVCVTGDLGGAYVGLLILVREKQVFLSDSEMQPELEDHEYPIKRQLKPEARTDVIFELEELNVVPTSGIDLSDGLSSDLMHICKASDVGAHIFSENLPIDESVRKTALELNIDPTTCMLNGGEDYELLFTVSKEDLPTIKNHPDITVIGEIKEKNEGIHLITSSGQAVPFQAQGWSHF